MAGNALPLLLLGGAAVMLTGGKKKKKSTDLGELPAPPEKEGAEAKPTAGEPVPGPSEPGSDVEPGPGPVLPQPETPKRPLGPSGVGSCANPIYTREALYIDPAVASRLNQGALTAYNDAGYYFYIRPDAQDEIFDMGLKTFASMAAQQTAPTVRSVILREILSSINNKCDWEMPTDKFDQPMILVWEDGIRLLTLAQMMAKYSDPSSDNLFKTGKRYTIPRAPLGMNDPGFPNPKINQRTMIVATDKSMQNAEHLIGRVSKLTGPNGEPSKFEIRIVDSFKGSDVSPKRTTKHGFKVMSNAFFSRTTPTGIYRFFPEGEV